MMRHYIRTVWLLGDVCTLAVSNTLMLLGSPTNRHHQPSVSRVSTHSAKLFPSAEILSVASGWTKTKITNEKTHN